MELVKIVNKDELIVEVNNSGTKDTVQFVINTTGNFTKIQAYDITGIPYCTVTLNPESFGIHVTKEDQVIIKDYSENEGVLDILKQLNLVEGIVEITHRVFLANINPRYLN